MSERISRLCDELRIKLHGLDRRLESLKSNGVATFDHSQDALESQLDRVEQRIYDHRAAVEAANARAKTWVAEKKSGLHAIHVLRNGHDKIYLLGAEADDAENYAADEAILATLQALLARNKVDQAAFPETDSSI
jgi:hypothetical protein